MQIKDINDIVLVDIDADRIQQFRQSEFPFSVIIQVQVDADASGPLGFLGGQFNSNKPVPALGF